MKPKILVALGLYLALALLAFFTLEGKIRLATLIFLGGFALKMCLVVLQRSIGLRSRHSLPGNIIKPPLR